MFRQFANDESGNIITVLGLSTLTLLGAVSAGLDYTRMTSTRAALSAAADAAALAAAQAPPAQAAALARQVFDANFRNSQSVTAFSAEQFTRGTDSAFRVDVTADVDMSLTRMLGAHTRPVRSLSEVLMGNDQDVQIALTLDVTLSMQGAKLSSLKASASSMVNSVFDKLTRPNQVKVAVVPFANYVNIGMANRNQPWISVPPDSTTTQNVCWLVADEISRTNCRQELQTWTACNDGVCGPQSAYVEVCDIVYGPSYQQCGTHTTTTQWNGCLGSRNYPLNVRDENYTMHPVPGVMNLWCNRPLTPLTTNRSVVLSAISDLYAHGDTYIPSGLMWGWAALSPGAPFDEPTDNTRVTKRYLVLMTDGENTRSPNYPDHDGFSPSVSDGLTQELCTNIKAAGIEIFTIAFEVPAGPTKNMLRNCASSNDKYFDATNATQLANAFDNIAGQMSALRISR